MRSVLGRSICGIVAVVAATAAQASDCPTSKDGKAGFVVERSGSSKTEIFHLDNGQTRTIGRFVGNLTLEVTHHHGVVQLDRVDRGQRTTYAPKSDLKPLATPKVGTTYELAFEQTDARGQVSTRHVQLKALLKDKLGIGACTYDVIKFEERVGNGGQALSSPGLFYWSPELKMILARASVSAGGAETLTKFDRIARLKP